MYNACYHRKVHRQFIVNLVVERPCLYSLLIVDDGHLPICVATQFPITQSAHCGDEGLQYMGEGSHLLRSL